MPNGADVDHSRKGLARNSKPSETSETSSNVSSPFQSPPTTLNRRPTPLTSISPPQHRPLSVGKSRPGPADPSKSHVPSDAYVSISRSRISSDSLPFTQPTKTTPAASDTLKSLARVDATNSQLSPEVAAIPPRSGHSRTPSDAAPVLNSHGLKSSNISSEIAHTSVSPRIVDTTKLQFFSEPPGTPTRSSHSRTSSESFPFSQQTSRASNPPPDASHPPQSPKIPDSTKSQFFSEATARPSRSTHSGISSDPFPASLNLQQVPKTSTTSSDAANISIFSLGPLASDVFTTVPRLHSLPSDIPSSIAASSEFLPRAGTVQADEHRPSIRFNPVPSPFRLGNSEEECMEANQRLEYSSLHPLDERKSHHASPLQASSERVLHSAMQTLSMSEAATTSTRSEKGVFSEAKIHEKENGFGQHGHHVPNFRPGAAAQGAAPSPELSVHRTDGAKSAVQTTLQELRHGISSAALSLRHRRQSRTEPEDRHVRTHTHSPAPRAAQTQRRWRQFKLDVSQSLSDEMYGRWVQQAGDTEMSVNRRRIYNFLQVPWQLEKLLVFGLCICIDSFLFLFTFLPLRFAIACFISLSSFVSNSYVLTSAHIFDLMRGGICLICTWLLLHMDMSKAYHHVRGQAAIKLYVIFNMLELFDKLFCSFGQDVIDALFWSAVHNFGTPALLNTTTTTPTPSPSPPTQSVTSLTSPPIIPPSSSSMPSQPMVARRRPCWIRLLSAFRDFSIASIYMFLHALVLFYQVVTLTVAVNSHNNSLLTVLVSNNFVELKGSVFKKFEQHNLFQIAGSDMVERFQLLVYLTILLAQHVSSSDGDVLKTSLLDDPMFRVWISIWGAEHVVDWVKHAFVTKFNQIPPDVYAKFKRTLCADLAPPTTAAAGPRSQVDRSQAVARKINFVPLPLACVATRCLIQAQQNLSGGTVLLALAAYALTWATKMVLHLALRLYAARKIADAR